MKAIFLALFFCVSVLVSKAQKLKPYLAIVKTINGKQKGILQKVDSASLILNVDGALVRIKNEEIKSISIRNIKKEYVGINLLKFGSEEEYNYDSRGKLVDKWGKEAPSLEEEVGITIFSAFFTAIVNGIALPFHAINPNLANIKLYGNKNKAQLEELSYYSIYYQVNPNVLAELRKIKEISATVKP